MKPRSEQDGGVRRGPVVALALGLFALPGCGGSAGAGGQDGSSSSSPSADVCTQALQILQETVAPDPVTLKRGDWGAIPPVLQKLPPDGVLCGSAVGDAGSAGTVVLTHLTGQALFDFYAPLMTAAGCPADSGDSSGPLFTFVCADATPASIDATAPGHAYIVIGFG